MALKNLGVWLASYTVSGIKADPASFGFAFLIYACITIPSDIFLLNHMSSQITENATKGATTEETPK